MRVIERVDLERPAEVWIRTEPKEDQGRERRAADRLSTATLGVRADPGGVGIEGGRCLVGRGYRAWVECAFALANRPSSNGWQPRIEVVEIASRFLCSAFDLIAKATELGVASRRIGAPATGRCVEVVVGSTRDQTRLDLDSSQHVERANPKGVRAIRYDRRRGESGFGLGVAGEKRAFVLKERLNRRFTDELATKHVVVLEKPIGDNVDVEVCGAVRKVGACDSERLAVVVTVVDGLEFFRFMTRSDGCESEAKR